MHARTRYGRLLAEMMTGEVPFAEPSRYVANRFGNRVAN
jgi:hypothetical protein